VKTRELSTAATALDACERDLDQVDAGDAQTGQNEPLRDASAEAPRPRHRPASHPPSAAPVERSRAGPDEL
jgi:hypothetical protein